MIKLLWTLPLLAALPALAQTLYAAAPSTVAQGGSVAEPGAAVPRRNAGRAFRPVMKYGVEGLALEVGHLPQSSEADTSALLRGSVYALWQPLREWEFRAGVRGDGWIERGGVSSLDDWRADLGDTYARYRSGDTRLTFGAQTIIWGRVDDIAPSDRVSRVDLGRFLLDDLADRRLPQLALRWEQVLGDYKLDAVAMPVHRGARLPDLDSVWSPVNRQDGGLIGVESTPPIAALVRSAAIGESHDGSGGAAVRFTRVGVPPFDFGVTLARTRQTLPYYDYGGEPSAPTLTAVYPYVSFVGADIEFVTGGLTWRSEVGVSDGTPATRASDGRALYTQSLDWVGALEFFPGAGDTRVSLQLAARSLRTDEPVLQLTEFYSLNGEVSTTLGQGRWRVSGRFLTGLNVHDVYLAPKLSYLGWEPHEVYVAAHHFDGEPRTLGGFHSDHDLWAVGLKLRF